MNDLKSLAVALPEIVVVLGALVSLVIAGVLGGRAAKPLGAGAIGVFCIAVVAMFFPGRAVEDMSVAFGHQFIDDGFARFAKTIVLGVSSLSILLSWNYFDKEGQARPEYPVLVMFAVLGMMLMISANDLLSLYVGLELQSLSLYVLAAFHRDSPKSSEAGLKYFALGAFSSGLLLYGISLIYGFAGTIEFDALAMALPGKAHVGVFAGIVFVCAGLAFKLAGAPFHMWAPDVYEGAPTPVAAFFAAAPKLAAFALLTRFLFVPVSGLSDEWRLVLVFISVMSMLWGSFAGLMQTDLKRLLAYSAVTNVGYLLVGLIAGGQSGIHAVLMYFAIYALNTIGAFAVVLCLWRSGKPVETIDDLSGLSKTNPILALAMAVLMFSLAGLPPMAGFIGKYVVFLAAVEAGAVSLAVTAVLASVVAAFFYLRIVKVMYFDEPLAAIDPLPGWSVRGVVAFSSIAMVGLTIVPGPVVESALRAAKSFSGLI